MNDMAPFDEHAALAAHLAPIRARADAATPGPWYQGHNRQFESLGEAWTREDMLAPDSYDLFPISARPEDAEFIAAARTDIPALLDIIEQQGTRLVLAEKTINILHNRIGREMNFSVLRSELLGDLEAYEAAKETL